MKQRGGGQTWRSLSVTQTRTHTHHTDTHTHPCSLPSTPSEANFERSLLSEYSSVCVRGYGKLLFISFPTSLSLRKVTKDEHAASSEDRHMRWEHAPQWRGYRIDGAIGEGAASLASVQTPFGWQKYGDLGGVSGHGGCMARFEATHFRAADSQIWICEMIGGESVFQRAASHKHATTSWTMWV